MMGHPRPAELLCVVTSTPSVTTDEHFCIQPMVTCLCSVSASEMTMMIPNVGLMTPDHHTVRLCHWSQLQHCSVSSLIPSASPSPSLTTIFTTKGYVVDTISEQLTPTGAAASVASAAVYHIGHWSHQTSHHGTGPTLAVVSLRHNLHPGPNFYSGSVTHFVQSLDNVLMSIPVARPTLFIQLHKKTKIKN